MCADVLCVGISGDRVSCMIFLNKCLLVVVYNESNW